jgi:hypothetical protein
MVSVLASSVVDRGLEPRNVIQISSNGAVVRVNKYDGNIHSLLRQNLDRQPMGLAIVAPDANKCKPCYWFGIVQ